MKLRLILWRSLLWGFALGLLFTGSIGVMHLPGFRESKVSQAVLTFLSSACPVNQISVDAVEKLRRYGVAQMRGSNPAPRRPAMGFVLDRTTEAEAKRLLAAKGIACQENSRGFRLLLCKNVRPEALGMKPTKEIRELVLAFSGEGRLIQVSLFRRQLSLADIGPILSETSSRLRAALGEPLSQPKEPFSSSMTDLGKKMSAITIEYRFADYIAKVTAANLPSGLSVYEQYMSAAE